MTIRDQLHTKAHIPGIIGLPLDKGTTINYLSKLLQKNTTMNTDFKEIYSPFLAYQFYVS